MKQYTGAVLFVDMLGIGALTQRKIKLSDEEYAPWKVDSASKEPHQLLAARLLLQFRRSLTHTKKACALVQVAQLSDCAFLWSSDPAAVVEATRELMWNTTRAGLLCRAGLAFGQIVEPDRVNRNLGQFILGDAVTKAVELESSGKGVRVFCNNEIARKILASYQFENNPFAPLRNPLDGTVVEEFRWYMLHQPITPNGENQADNDRKAAIGLIELLTILKYSPRLNWNACSQPGLLQIACSVEAVSQLVSQYVPKLDLFSSAETIMASGNSKRSEARQKRIKAELDSEVSQLLARKR